MLVCVQTDQSMSVTELLRANAQKIDAAFDQGKRFAIADAATQAVLDAVVVPLDRANPTVERELVAA